jgi:hypothetical protein
MYDPCTFGFIIHVLHMLDPSNFLPGYVIHFSFYPSSFILYSLDTLRLFPKRMVFAKTLPSLGLSQCFFFKLKLLHPVFIIVVRNEVVYLEIHGVRIRYYVYVDCRV